MVDDIRSREHNIASKENISMMKVVATKPECLHSHDFIEIEYIYMGSGTQVINGVRHDVSRGSVLFFNIGDCHAYYPNGKMGIINCLINPDFIHDDLVTSENAMDILCLAAFREFDGIVDAIPNIKSYTGRDMLKIDAMFNAMCDEFEEKRSGYLNVLKHYVNILLTVYFREFGPDSSSGIYGELNKLAPQIFSYIEANYNRKISLNELAAISFYSPAYFSSLFKECMGKTITEYISEVRIAAAVKLLKETDLSIADICIKVGYSDKKRFYSNFKTVMGTTPSAYRTVSRNYLISKKTPSQS